MRRLQATPANLFGAALGFLALAILFVACPLLAILILFVLFLIPVK